MQAIIALYITFILSIFAGVIYTLVINAIGGGPASNIALYTGLVVIAFLSILGFFAALPSLDAWAKKITSDPRHDEVLQQFRSELPAHLTRIFALHPGRELRVEFCGQDLHVYLRGSFWIPLKPQENASITNCMLNARQSVFGPIKTWVLRWSRITIIVSPPSSHEIIEAIALSRAAKNSDMQYLPLGVPVSSN